MRDQLAGYTAAAFESAAAAGRLAQVREDLLGFDRALISSSHLHEILTDSLIPYLARRGVVDDLLASRATPEAHSIVRAAIRLEWAGELGAVLAELMVLVERAEDAVAAGQVAGDPRLHQASEVAVTADPSRAGAPKPQRDEESLEAAPGAISYQAAVLEAVLGLGVGMRSRSAGGRIALHARLAGYAERVFSELSSLSELDVIEDELFGLARAVGESTPLLRALSNPDASSDSLVALLETLLAGRVQEATLRLCRAALRSGRVRDPVGTFDWLVELAAAERGRRVAEVHVAVDLEADERDRLAASLAEIAERPVELRVVLDSHVLGGMQVRLGDTIIDGTLRRRFDQLRGELTHAELRH